MASKYAKPLQVPEQFPDVLRNFAREALRLQGKVETKEQIYEFGAQYFQELLVKRDGSSAKLAAAASSGSTLPVYMKAPEEELMGALQNAFSAIDPENSGIVGFDGFQQALGQVAEQLQFTSTEIKALFAEADENDQGQIAYGDFIPLAFQAILHLRSNRSQRLTRAEQYAKRQDIEIFLHGHMQDEMESLLREILQRADADDSGTLGRVEFMDCLRDADLGLTRREVNALMAEAPVSEHDPARVAYSDFVPICFPSLRDIFVHGVIELPNDQDALAQYLVEVFASGDSDSTGLLPVAELTRLFRAADIGLTRLQIIILMAEAQEDKSGFVNYEKFAAHVAGMALVLVSFDSYQQFGAYLHKYRKTSEYYTVLDMNQHSFEQTLAHALEALDEQHRGLLPRQDVVEAIQNAFPDVSQRQMRCLLALADMDEMGDVEYPLITHSAFPALQKLHEYDMMIMES